MGGVFAARAVGSETLAGRGAPGRKLAARWRLGEWLCPKLIAMQRSPEDAVAESRYAAALNQPATAPMLAPRNNTPASVPAT